MGMGHIPITISWKAGHCGWQPKQNHMELGRSSSPKEGECYDQEKDRKDVGQTKIKNATIDSKGTELYP